MSYIVSITRVASYEIEANSPEEAEDIAFDPEPWDATSQTYRLDPRVVEQWDDTTGHRVEAYQPLAFTGPEIVKLMRRHPTTIDALATKLGITKQRIRQVRTKGVTGAAALDWREAIAGVSPTRYEVAAMRGR